MRPSIGMRGLAVLLAVTLLPILPMGGSNVLSGAAQAGYIYSENGLIEMEPPWFDGYRVYFYWDVDDSIDYEAALYRMPDEAVNLADPGNLSDGFYVHDLEPGDYKFVLRVYDEGDQLDQLVHVFNVPGPETMQVYVFGTETPIPDLKFIDDNGEEIAPTAVAPAAGKGYVRYTVEVSPYGCFDLTSASVYFSNARDLCAYNGQEFVVQAHDTEYVLDLYDFFVIEQVGLIMGEVRFDRRASYDGYEMILYGKDGSSSPCSISGDIESGWWFTCSNPPQNPAYLQLYTLDGSTSHPSNVKILLDDIELPKDFTVVDKDPVVGWIEPEIEFKGIADETGIALYKIVPPQDDTIQPVNIGYAPAGGKERYSVALRENRSSLHSYMSLWLIDTDGNVYAQSADVPIVDNISGLNRSIQYGGCNEEHNYCEEYVTVYLDESFAPEDASFTDSDMDEGGRAGNIEWTLSTDFYWPAAYDLYYASAEDDNSIIRGEARVRLPYEPTETFSYPLQDIPAGAEYLAVVPIIAAEGYYYYAQTFFVPLVDRVAPRLDQLLVNGTPVSPQQQDPTRYEFMVEWNAEAASVTASSEDGIVYVDGEGPDSTVTKAVYLNGPATSVPIQVKTPEQDWTAEYELTIIKAPAPDAPALTSLAVNGQTVQPVGSLYKVPVPYGTETITVTAAAGPGVEISLNGNVHAGAAEEVIPITENELYIPIVLHDPATTMTAEYTLHVVRMAPDNLVLDVASGWLKAGDDGLEYGFVPRRMTAGTLKEQFMLVDGASIEIRDASGNPAADAKPVTTGSTVWLTLAGKVQIIRLHLLSDQLRDALGLPSGSPVTFAHVAAYVMHRRIDVTGDGRFDQRDVRLLLGEIE